jgi:hypothetical protein
LRHSATDEGGGDEQSPDTVAPMRFVRVLAGPFFVFAGTMHFVMPRTYARIVPPYLPRHRELVYASGVAEAVGGLGLIPRATRRLAGWWLIATLIAIWRCGARRPRLLGHASRSLSCAISAIRPSCSVRQARHMARCTATPANRAPAAGVPSSVST